MSYIKTHKTMILRIKLSLLLLACLFSASGTFAQKKKFFNVNDVKCKENTAYYYRIIVQQGTLFKVTEYYTDNEQLKMEGQYRSKKLEYNSREGNFNWYYSNGQKYCQGQYKNGKAEGKWTYWYKDGQVKREGNYESDYREGEWNFYHRNGKILCKPVYKEGDLDGNYKEYYDNGDIKLDKNFSKGKSHGEFTVYFEGNKIKRKGSYEKDSLDGSFIRYWKDGKTAIKGDFRDNKRVGTWEFFHSNGNLSCTVEYNSKGGFIKAGFYDEDGQKMSKKVTEDDLYKEAEHPDGRSEMNQEIFKKLGDKMDYKGAKAHKYTILIKCELTIDEEGNIIARDWEDPDEDDDLFYDRWDVVKFINSAIDDFPKFKPSKAYNRNFEDEVNIQLYFDFSKI